MSNKITCTCGHSWNKSSSSKKDMRICHICGKDNTMKNGGWLDAYDDKLQLGGNVYPVNYVPQAENGIEGTMGGLTDKGFNYNGAWGGTMKNGGDVPQAQNGIYGGLNFLEPTSKKLPEGYNPKAKGSSTEYAESIGGEDGEPAYLIPGFKYGKLLDNPKVEFKRTGDYLGGPFKTWQDADQWERDIRHPYVEKGQTIPTPLRRWGKEFAMGGSLPGSVGFTYARTGEIPDNGPYAKKTLASAQNGGEMSFYQNGLDWTPKNISKQGSKIKKDDNGYWNPDNWGEPVEIGSNEITMRGVYEPLLGISDTGDTQMMYPGEDYKFDGESVTEYPVAQPGLTVIPQPTRADSIMLLKNSMIKNAFYKNNPNYTTIKSSLNLRDPKVLQNLAKNSEATKLQYRYNKDSDILGESNPYNSKQFTITAGDIKRRTGKVAGSNNVYSAPDIESGDFVDEYFNPASPPIFFSPSILPQGAVRYNSTKLSGYGDVSQSPYYDPLAVTPWDMLPPPQQKLRLKKYGTTGTPYDTTPKTTTTPPVVSKPKPKYWTEKDVPKDAWISFIKKHPGAIGMDPFNVDKTDNHLPIYPTKKPKPTPKKEQPVKQTENPPTPAVKTTPQPAQTPVVERRQNSYEGSPIYYPGVGSGAASALVGFANQRGDTTYIKPEDYQRFAVPASGKEFIESKTKKKKNGGWLDKWK